MDQIPTTPVGSSKLPFRYPPSGSIAAPTIDQSVYSPTPRPKVLSDDAPNVVVILIDDAGPALPDALGGEVHTPTLQRVLDEGLGYNRFHTTAMCSPTRASMLTGRNHHRVGNGQIAELANDWDGYSGRIPRSSALQADVLREYGYSTSAFGKWHNTPAAETSETGPFHNWPTSLGFEYFYGFLSGEASQYEPHLVRNTTVVAPPATPEEGYHLSEDLAEDAVTWLRKHQAMQADKPFYMYWASGAIHGPHHVHSEWADKYAGKFDDGWDAYRERHHERAKQLGWIPEDAELTPRHPQMAAWDDIPEEQKPFQARLMEVCAGFAEHADVQAGKILDELDRLGIADNTLVFYVWGDNGSSGEGQDGTISELLAQNMIPTTIDQHIDTLESLGGLEVLGTPLVDNMYHAGWAWAGSSPYLGMKLMASYLGGTRNPMAVRWPAGIDQDGQVRTQFHHVNDLVPTIYEAIGITPPETVNGIEQDPIDGTSFAYTFNDADADGRLKTQYFEIMGSRSIYHEGWMASAVGPRLPWTKGVDPKILQWTPDNDRWELYNLDEDWSQANDLADQMPEKVAQLKNLFLVEATKNQALPIGGGLWIPVFHPEMRLAPSQTEWVFPGDMTRIPEVTAPQLGFRESVVTLDVDLPEQPSGVLYKLGANAGGLTLFIQDGVLIFEYNLFIIQRTQVRSSSTLPVGPATIGVITTPTEKAAAGPLQIVLEVNGERVAEGVVPVSAPLFFTANDCLDFGQALGSPVSLDYFKLAPFAFNGTIHEAKVRYVENAEQSA
jgi:arylsulfatase A-like enzyme